MVNNKKMTKKDIKELLDLTGWSQAELSRRLGMSEPAVSRWFTDRKPNGAAVTMMRHWLTEAREEVRKQPA